MNRIFRFKHHLRAQPLDEERVFLLSESVRFMLRGRVYGLLVPLIDGRRTILELIAALEGTISPPEVYYALMNLEEKGYIAEATADLAPATAGFWEALGADAASASASLSATHVAVQAFGAEEPRPLVEAFEAAGIAVSERAEVHVVLTDDYLADGLDAWNREAQRRGVRWMLIKPSGVEGWIGPMFSPGAGPCWACLAARVRENRPVETYLERRAERSSAPTPPRVASPVGQKAVLGFSALLLARWIAEGGRGVIDEKLLTLDLKSSQTTEHPVVRRPQCPACGDPEMLRRRALLPVALESRPKRFTLDGGHRSVPPEETLARHLRQVSPISGVLSDLRPLSEGDDPLRQVYGAISRICPRQQAPSFDDFHRLSSGKGRTPQQARAGALAEAIERYSAVFQGDEHRIRASYADLGEGALHPDALQNFSEVQLRTRDATNPAHRDLRRSVPLPFDERAQIDWTPLWSLTEERHRYAPTSYCYFQAPVPDEALFCYFNPNGHAAGNYLEEAILQGFLELVERDAVAVWWYNRLRRPGVDLQSFREPYFMALEELYRSMGMRLWVLDVTHDLEIPAFVAVAKAKEGGRIWAGCGCHLEPRLAVQRALTEVNQCFDPRGAIPAPWKESALEDPSYLYPDSAAPARTRDDFSEIQRDDLRDDIRACVERAARAGLETLVLDQTRPDVGLSAVKVVVPGLRHFWPRLGPGRLYDVPVRMGWRDALLGEAQMNPEPFYL